MALCFFTMESINLSCVLVFYLLFVHVNFLHAMEKTLKKAPLILLSFDGLGWKELESNRTHTPNFDFLAKSGVKAKRLMGVHPTKTFPIHTTFLTGLYPESHGIIDNKFWDPKYLSKFIMEHDCSNFDSKFYNESEPLWLTLEKRGKKTGAFYWPGSTSYDQKPSFHAKEFCNIDCSKYQGPMMREYLRLYFKVHCFFNWAKSYQSRIDTMVDEWLMADTPPAIVTMYIEEPDLEGHKNGPNSKEYLEKIESLDKHVLGYLLRKLKKRQLIDKTNIIVVSDHGLVETKNTRQIRLYDYIKPGSYFNKIAAREHIWPKPGRFKEVYNKLKNSRNPHFKVYMKNDIPENLHFKNNRRVPPIYLIMEEGWLMRPDWNALAEGEWTEGTHGWPPTENSAGIFYARGPDFKRNYSSPSSAHAIDIYSLLCHLLDEKPLPNNGSLLRITEFLRGNETYNFSKMFPYDGPIFQRAKYTPKIIPTSVMTHGFTKSSIDNTDISLTTAEIKALKEIFEKLDTTPAPINTTGNNITDILRILALQNNQSNDPDHQEQEWFKECEPANKPDWKDDENDRDTDKKPVSSIERTMAAMPVVLTLSILIFYELT